MNHKKYRYILCVFIGSIVFTESKPNTLQEQLSLFTNTQLPKPALLKLLKETNIAHDSTLSGIVAATQKPQSEGGWMRQENKERWELGDLFSEKNAVIFSLFQELDMVDTIQPSASTYDHGIILGSTLESIRIRIRHLADILKEGVHIKKLTFLCSQRSLDKNLENKATLYDANNGILAFKKEWKPPHKTPKTETEMVQMVLDQSDLPIDFTAHNTTIIDTPNQINHEGSIRRANTADTVLYWLETAHPFKGSILAISNQPYVGYQGAVLKTVLADQFTIETVGKTDHEKIAVILDCLARWLYQELKRQALTT